MAVATRWSLRSDKVYYACAAYKEATWKEFTKKDGTVHRYPTRGKDNGKVLAVRSLWEDIDVGKEDATKCYPTAGEAVRALGAACKTVGLPIPMVVHSGKGVHCYWPLTEDVTYDQWAMLAELKKAAFLHAGLRIDTSRAADVKSVLRPLGIQGSGGNPVRLLRDAGPFDYQDLFDTLQRYTALNTLTVQTPRAPRMADVNDELGGFDYPPSSAYRIADHCAQVRHFRDLMGDVGYDLWWIHLGLLKHTLEGEALVHEWSSGHPGYSYDETQSKLDDWGYGPSSCARMMTCNPQDCEGCQYQGKVKSPIQLGYGEQAGQPKPKPVEAHATPVLPEAIASVLAAPAADPLDDYAWPTGFGVNPTGKMTEARPDANGVIQHVPFASTIFLIKDRIRNIDDTRAYHIQYKVRVSKTEWAWREFSLPSILMADMPGFAKLFASYEIYFFGKEGVPAAMRYIRDYITSNAHSEVKEVQHMGWMRNSDGQLEDAFVLGRNVITQDSEHPVRMSDKLAGANNGRHGVYTTSGDKNKWLDMVNRIYSRAGAEAHQMTILAGFASPLVELIATDNWHGIPIALTNGGSSGKSTVCNVVSSIYAHPGTLFFRAGEDESTLNAMTARAGLLCNLPMTFDEMTKRKPEEVKGLVYQLPAGAPKERLRQDGTLINHGLHWNMLPIITSNQDLYALLQQFGGFVSGATQVRIFEVRLAERLSKTLWPDIDPTQEIEEFIKANHGHVGREWLRFVIKNRGAITAQLLKARSKYTPHNCGMDADERYYADLMAMIMVTGKLLKKVLGWVHFDMKNLERWMNAMIEENRFRRNDAALKTVSDKLSSLVRSSHDTILVTKHFPLHARGNSYALEAAYEKPRRGVQIRMATEDKRLLISAERLEEWCEDMNVNRHQFINELHAEGYLKLTIDLSRRKNAAVPGRTNLGKGTHEVTGQVRCYEIDYEKWAGADQGVEKVVSIEASREIANA